LKKIRTKPFEKRDSTCWRISEVPRFINSMIPI